MEGRIDAAAGNAEWARLSALKGRSASAPAAQGATPPVIQRDTLVQHAQIGGATREELAALMQRYDTDNQPGLSETEFEALFAAATGAPNRTAEQMRQEATDLFFEPVSGESSISADMIAETRKVHADPQAAASKQVKLNGEAEAHALASLTPEQQSQYAGVVKLTKKDPEARLALQVLLAEGKLTSQSRSEAGQDLLAELAALAEQPLAEGLEREALVSDLIQEVFAPAAISQSRWNNCTVASMQMLMARNQPAEYARVVAGLASPEGSVRLANGDKIAREPGTERPDEQSWAAKLPFIGRYFETARSAPSRLWQPALMEYANDLSAEEFQAEFGEWSNKSGVRPGAYEVDYRGDEDQNHARVQLEDGTTRPANMGSGLFASQASRALEAVLGQDMELIDVAKAPAGERERAAKAAMARMASEVGAGEPVLAVLDVKARKQSFAHQILVTGIDDKRVRFFNSMEGTVESLPRAEFERRLAQAHVRPR